MASIFGILFGSSGRFTSTKKYEKAQKKEKKDFLKFTNYLDSGFINRYCELEELVHSEEYTQRVDELKKEKQYKQSEEKNNFDEYKKLQKDKEIKWYLNTLKKDFKEQKEWTMTFEEDFNSAELDVSKWMTGYYWGKALINDVYVLAGEKQFYLESNINITNSAIHLKTKKERAKGKIWDPAIGFIDRDFNYTSALISTGKSFRQKYGKFEAKIKFRGKYPIVSAFWMLGDTILPQIDVFKTSNMKGNELESGIHTLKNKTAESKLTTIKDVLYKGQYFIYSLEWTEDALIWRINGTEVHRETENIPDEEMYMTFCTTLPKNPKSMQLPASMDIDWIRCYQRV